ncbi:MAG TPA: hypothetical protein VIM64_20435 [Puia sp.]
MKLEFLDDLTDGGKYVDVVSERLIRLYDFDKHQASRLKKIIEEEGLGHKKEISLSALDFVSVARVQMAINGFMN